MPLAFVASQTAQLIAIVTQIKGTFSVSCFVKIGCKEEKSSVSLETNVFDFNDFDHLHPSPSNRCFPDETLVNWGGRGLLCWRFRKQIRHKQIISSCWRCKRMNLPALVRKLFYLSKSLKAAHSRHALLRLRNLLPPLCSHFRFVSIVMTQHCAGRDHKTGNP